jgi:DNA-binding HxlR family transcriptional regulator
VSVTYEITPLGRTLVVALTPMIDWAETRMGEVEAARQDYDAREG